MNVYIRKIYYFVFKEKQSLYLFVLRLNAQDPFRSPIVEERSHCRSPSAVVMGDCTGVCFTPKAMND